MARVSKRGAVRVFLAAAVPLLLAAGAAQVFGWAARSTGDAQAWLFVAGAALSLLAIGLTAFTKVREHQRGATVDSATNAQLIALSDEIRPLATAIAEMARLPLDQRRQELRVVAQGAVIALRSIVAQHASRSRAVVYLLNVDAMPLQMESIGHNGRGARPRPFVEGTTRGDAALAFLEERSTAYYRNLNGRKKPAGYDGTMAGYRTFIAAPIFTGAGVYGMVTLDAPEANSLTTGDVALTELVADLMAIPFEVAQDQDAPEAIS
jgi:hypothetical protein